VARSGRPERKARRRYCGSESPTSASATSMDLEKRAAARAAATAVVAGEGARVAVESVVTSLGYRSNDRDARVLNER
jgi:hypothetical protein